MEVNVNLSAVRLLGLGVIVIGVVFVIVGVDSTQAPLEHVSHALTGTYTHETMLYITGGLAAIIAGAVLAVVRPR